MTSQLFVTWHKYFDLEFNILKTYIIPKEESVFFNNKDIMPAIKGESRCKIS